MLELLKAMCGLLVGVARSRGVRGDPIEFREDALVPDQGLLHRGDGLCPRQQPVVVDLSTKGSAFKSAAAVRTSSALGGRN